jgi:hypothetical protein
VEKIYLHPTIPRLRHQTPFSVAKIRYRVQKAMIFLPQDFCHPWQCDVMTPKMKLADVCRMFDFAGAFGELSPKIFASVHSLICVGIIFGSFAISALTSAMAEPATTNVASLSNEASVAYRTIALNDLERMRDVIISAHPAFADTSASEVSRRLDLDYSKAVTLANLSSSESDVLATDRFFASSLQDSHVAVLAPDRVPSKSLWAGWTMDYDGTGFYVAYRASEWPAQLLPLRTRGSTMRRRVNADITLPAFFPVHRFKTVFRGFLVDSGEVRDA